jgi:chromosome segregation ATPase
VLGLAQLGVRRAQNRALAQVEDFLAQRAELPSSLLGGESALPAYLEALLKQTAESLSEIQRMMVRTEEERRATQGALASLTETLGAVSDQLRAQQKVILTLSKNHYDLQPAIADLATQVAGALAGSEEMRSHLRNLDLSVARLVDEVSAARAQTPEAMRQEIKVLAQTLRNGARNGDRPHF